MASLTIRKLDEGIKTYLRLRSARNRRSVEEEVRVILGELIEGREEPLTPFTAPPAASATPRPSAAAPPRGQRHPDHRRRDRGLQIARPDPQAQGAADRGPLRADQGGATIRHGIGRERALA